MDEPIQVLVEELLVGDEILNTAGFYREITRVEKLGNTALYCVSIHNGPGIQVSGKTPVIIRMREQIGK